MTKHRALAPAFLLFSLLLFSSCQPKQRVRTATEKHYDLKGKVVLVDKAKRELTIAHEDIKDHMPSMTMPFSVREDWVFEIAAPGNQITATLIVDGTQSWLEDVVITEDSTPVAGAPPVEGADPNVGDAVPDYALLNQDGKTIRIRDYKGKALLLTFIYTRCQDPNQCTLMSSNFAAIDKELQKQPELYAKTHLLSISFDPAYDTPKVLRSYGAAYTGKYSDETFAHWEFASGSADEVKGIAKFFGLRYFQDTPNGTEQVIHSLRTAVIGPDGKIVKVYRGNEWKTEELLKELQSVMTVK
ncbi:MAG TPA: SCO family protein [Pyrinomonadaceae bacterium]|jgi:protein SCO1/2|nr:SCO family protein [Pyrinomonadaceae bacterium]